MPGVIASIVGAVMRETKGRADGAEVQRMIRERIERGDFDPSFIVSHRLSLDDAAQGYEMFKNKEDNCTKIVLTP